jgi:MFS family permease
MSDDSVAVASRPREVAARVGKASRYPVIILMLIQADDQMDRFLLSALFPAIKDEFRLSDTQLGLLSSAFVIVATAAAVPFGVLVDRYIRVRIAAVGEAVRSGAMILTGLAGTYPLLFATRSLLGAAEASYSPAAFSLISDYYPVRERGRMLGLYQVGAILGFVALPVGAYIGETWGWRAAFHVLAIQGFVLAMIAWRLPEPERGRQDREAAGLTHHVAGTASEVALLPLRQAFLSILRVPSVLVSVGSTALSTFFTTGLGIWAVTFLVRFHDMTLTQASLTTGLLGVGAIIGALAGGTLGDRLVSRGVVNGRLYVAGTAQIVGVALLMPALATDHTPTMIVLFGLGAITLTMPNPPLSAVQADVIHPDLRGRSVSIRSILNTASAAASPLLLGILSDSIGLRTAFLMVLPLFGMGGVVLLLLGPRFLSRDMENMQRQLSGHDDITTARPAREHSNGAGGEQADGRHRSPYRSLAALGAALVVAGFTTIAVTWGWVSDRVDPLDQVTWLIAAVLGLAAVLAGASLFAWARRSSTVDRTERLVERVDQLRAELHRRAGNAADQHDHWGTESGETYHRPDCVVLQAKPGVHPVSPATIGARGLRPCVLCDPSEPVSGVPHPTRGQRSSDG